VGKSGWGAPPIRQQGVWQGMVAGAKRAIERSKSTTQSVEPVGVYWIAGPGRGKQRKLLRLEAFVRYDEECRWAARAKKARFGVCAENDSLNNCGNARRSGGALSPPELRVEPERHSVLATARPRLGSCSLGDGRCCG